MIRPAPPASMHLTVTRLAAMMLAASAAHVQAAGINLLQPAPASTARVLIDMSRPPFESDDAAATDDRDCVAVSDPLRAASGYGRVSWTRGRLAWEWDRGREPALIYLVCLDRDGATWNAGGGMGLDLFAALSWANAPSASRAGTLASSVMPAPTSFDLGPTPFISIASGPVWFDLPVAMPTVGDHAPPRPPDPGADPIDVPAPPLVITDPGGMAPVPEPSTWLLVGTGVAAAWRAAKRK